MSETQHHVHVHIEQENIQTASDMDLFDDDDMEDTESQTRSQFDTPKYVVLQEASAMDLDDATSQPPTRTALPDKREKRVADSVLPNKRRIKEVDYSETLRETVYSQKELIHNMQTQVEKQKIEHEQNMNEMKQQWETTLRERQEQLAKAQEEIELAQEQVQREAELCEKLAQHEEELKRKTNEEAEKESELAKMEQRFSRCYRSQNEDVDMNIPTVPGDAGQPSPCAKPWPGTSCLDAIKRIKRTQGISHRVRLVSVASEVDGEEVPQQHSSKDVPPPPQHNAQPAMMMEDAIVRGVEAALRRVLIDKEFPLTKKHSPRRKKVEEKELRQEKAAEKSYERDFLLGEVRRLFKDIFSISQDSDFMLHDPASHEDVYAYEYEDGPGPNCKHLAFDLKELQRRGDQESWPFRRSEAYFREVLQDHYKHLHTVWMAAQPKVTAKGGLETPEEVEQRLITKKDEALKVTHQTTCQKNKYLRRFTVLNHLVKYKTNGNKEDLPAWQWLQRLVRMLGEGGMSLEERNIENDIETVLRVKNMTWHHVIE
ncbi:uncharacterized protein F5891DRAFT_1193391 [Suillus fuscotomentosus]|uniref:Uncharacterized protein n=1 Tax=Suillus fuscotomentosus TaxID=1912939 RepID=A0AAD4HGY1_9AGAM|nr:uncharacterized protein F5891DRAFT_1193391 [Suillus fuscotomentosus]KAG1896158.1 hypothetical protein F5891DRAFT_1193391 [Suillus fuscotomentosus]